ncbi:FixH family protein [Pontixanthobacter gangjinensis]|uniref:FixH family protein n=1 Tax=Christiangramia aestuarii TaxID=1028746 RepID=A0A7K1LRF6_9FLAO|nr:FixH family protein [Christiangramia aestuarii]MUP43060.1 FixH family protein [Christiangramia aestuarii]
MKINWGTGLVIGMLAFISFIMYFVVTMMSSTDYDHDLVVEDYYREELHYQQDIDAEKNALALEEGIEVYRDGNKLILKFPETMNLAELEGTVSFYRPSSKKLDFVIPFSEIENNRLLAPDDQMIAGRWNLKVRWQEHGKEYLFKKEILY